MKTDRLKKLLVEAAKNNNGSQAKSILVEALKEKELKQFENAIEPIIKRNIPEPKEPTDTRLLALIKPEVARVIGSNMPTDEHFLRLIRPLIPQVKDGKSPKIEDVVRQVIAKLDLKEIDRMELVNAFDEKFNKLAQNLEEDKKEKKQLESKFRSIDEQIKDIERRQEIVNSKGSSGKYAREIPVDTTNFNSNLSSADDTVQKALETLDDAVTGSSAFTGLTDTPSSYTGQAGKFAKVKATEDGLEFGSGDGIGDMLAANNLSDLADAATARTNLGVDPAGTDNSTPVTVTDSAEIDFTLTGQNITASLKAGSIDESKLDTSVNASLALANSALQNIVEDTTPQLGGNLDTQGHIILGGTSTTADLTFQTTSGVGATGADMHFKVGNNGATEALTILNNGDVGIGTTIPGSKLHISSPDSTNTQLTIAHSGAASSLLRFLDGTTEKGQVTYHSSGYMLLSHREAGVSIANTDLVLKEGNVGIGTTSPVDRLQIAGTMRMVHSTWAGPSTYVYADAAAPTSTGFRARGTPSVPMTVLAGDSLNSIAGFGYTGSAFQQAADISFLAGSDFNTSINGIIRFGTVNSGTWGERMRISANGNVGIGTTSPTAYLHIKAGTASANTAPIKLTAGTLNTTPESGAIEFDGTDFYFTI